MISFSLVTFFFFLVSHTDHDLVFIWNMTDPLVVNPEIELPQLDIAENYTTDCTIEYSTGEFWGKNPDPQFTYFSCFKEISRVWQWYFNFGEDLVITFFIPTFLLH